MISLGYFDDINDPEIEEIFNRWAEEDREIVFEAKGNDTISEQFASWINDKFEDNPWCGDIIEFLSGESDEEDYACDDYDDYDLYEDIYELPLVVGRDILIDNIDIYEDSDGSSGRVNIDISYADQQINIDIDEKNKSAFILKLRRILGETAEEEGISLDIEDIWSLADNLSKKLM